MAVVEVPMVEVILLIMAMAQVVTIIIKVIGIDHQFHSATDHGIYDSDIFPGFGSGGYNNNQGHGSGGDFELFSGGICFTESSKLD